jgi:hypothetical protein
MLDRENFENLAVPIDGESFEDKKEKVDKNINRISFLFAAEKFKVLKEVEDDLRFSFVLEKYSTLLQDLSNCYLNDKKEGDALGKIEALKQKADELYSEGGAEAVYDYLSLEREKWREPKEEPEQEIEETEEVEEKFGLVKHNISDAFGNGCENLPEIFEKIGITDYDKIMVIHIDEAFKNRGKIDFKDGFAKLAAKIKNETPFIRAILGRSWLVDSGVAEKIGFNKLEIDFSQNGYDTWLQFIDKDGQISKSRFEELLASGEIPHKTTAGYIMTEDFLKKYLPEEERGEVVLKEVNPAWVEFFEPIKNEFAGLKKNWDNIADVNALKKYLSENLLVSMDFLKRCQEGVDYFEVLLECKEKKMSFVDMRQDKEYVFVVGLLENSFEKDKYREKKVNI